MEAEAERMQVVVRSIDPAWSLLPDVFDTDQRGFYCCIT